MDANTLIRQIEDLFQPQYTEYLSAEEYDLMTDEEYEEWEKKYKIN
jgi:hypothetical protein